MPKDRDQFTPDDPDDAEVLASGRHQGTGGSGIDQLPGEDAPASSAESTEDESTE